MAALYIKDGYSFFNLSRIIGDQKYSRYVRKLTRLKLPKKLSIRPKSNFDISLSSKKSFQSFPKEKTRIIHRGKFHSTNKEKKYRFIFGLSSPNTINKVNNSVNKYKNNKKQFINEISSFCSMVNNKDNFVLRKYNIRNYKYDSQKSRIDMEGGGILKNKIYNYNKDLNSNKNIEAAIAHRPRKSMTRDDTLSQTVLRGESLAVNGPGGHARTGQMTQSFAQRAERSQDSYQYRSPRLNSSESAARGENILDELSAALSSAPVSSPMSWVQGIPCYPGVHL